MYPPDQLHVGRVDTPKWVALYDRNSQYIAEKCHISERPVEVDTPVIRFSHHRGKLPAL